MRIVIIEDEQIATDELVKCINSVSERYFVIKKLYSVKEAQDYLKVNDDYDLIFSDIQLGDGLCFEIFNEIEINKPIIFCTAYNEYLMDAFKSNGIDYILKPFNKSSIEKSISKYEKLFLTNNHIELNQTDILFNVNKIIDDKSIVLYHKSKIIPVNVSEIALFNIKYNLLRMYYFDGRSYIIDYTLEEIQKVTNSNFFRANRQFIVHRAAINEVIRLKNRKLKLNLKFEINDEIIISKEKANSFLYWLSSIK